MLFSSDDITTLIYLRQVREISYFMYSDGFATIGFIANNSSEYGCLCDYSYFTSDYVDLIDRFNCL